MKVIFNKFEELPMVLCAEHVAMVMGISRTHAYGLLHSEGFPTIRIGKRMVVPRDKFIQWMDNQVKSE